MPGMDIEQIAAELRQRLETWLDTPDETTEGVQELRERLKALKATIGAKAASELLKSLRGADQNARRAKCRTAADAIAAATRPLNVVLEARAPLQRQKRKPSIAKPAAGAQPEQQASAQETPETNPQPVDASASGREPATDQAKPRGFLRRAGGGA